MTLNTTRRGFLKLGGVAFAITVIPAQAVRGAITLPPGTYTTPEMTLDPVPGRVLLSVETITRDALEEFRNSMVLGNLVDRDWDTIEDPRELGATIRIRKPVMLSAEQMARDG